MTTHSPLPWTRYVSFDSWFVVDAAGEAVTIFGRTKMVAETPEPDVRITRNVPRPHADANCQLFFAAPQMLVALKAGVKQLRQYIADGGGCDHLAGICWCDVIRVADDMDAAITVAETVKDGTIAAAEHQVEREKAINDAFATGTAAPNEGEVS